MANTPEMDDWRSLVDMGRSIVDDFGLRPTRVFIVTEVFATVNPSGFMTPVNPPTQTIVEILPKPYVTELTPGDFVIDRITGPYNVPDQPGKGWSFKDLLPVQPPGTRTFIRLDGETDTTDTRSFRISMAPIKEPFGYSIRITDMQ